MIKIIFSTPTSDWNKFKDISLWFRNIEIVATRLRGRDGLFAKLLSLFPQMFREILNTEGAALEQKWASLRPSTIRQKQRQGFPTRPLFRTGALRTGLMVPGSAPNFVKWDNRAMAYGLKSNWFVMNQRRGSIKNIARFIKRKKTGGKGGGYPYPIFIQYGTSKMVARPFLGFPQRWIIRFLAVTRNYFSRKTAKIKGFSETSQTWESPE
ncbi:MAG: hypothetical protein ACOZAL_00595 [Patescibacteria group bacterium]